MLNATAEDQTVKSLFQFTTLSDTDRQIVLRQIVCRLNRNITDQCMSPIKFTSHELMNYFHFFYLATPNSDLKKRIIAIVANKIGNDDEQPFFTDVTSQHIIRVDFTELDNIAKIIVYLIDQWPENRNQYRLYLNLSLPQPIRFVHWYMHLSNANCMYIQRNT